MSPTDAALIKYMKVFCLFFFTGCWGCEKVTDFGKIKSEPINVFEESWNLINDHYSLFNIKRVNWDSVHTKFRSRVTNGMSDKDLFRVVDEMLETLKDGHVTLIANTDTATYEGFYKLYPTNFNYPNILNNYLKNNFQTSGPAIYSKQQNVGYIYYNSFRNVITEEQADKIISDLADTKGVIIDVRSNTGGKLENAEKIFKRFVTETKLVKYELIKKGSGHYDFFDPQPYYLSPASIIYKKPVCVLTNRACFSACNDFLLYMSELPNVKIVGDTSGGGGGIPNDYLLPNGWKIQYTSTVTLSPELKSIENGIDPGFNIGINAIDEANGRDPILEKAFNLLF